MIWPSVIGHAAVDWAALLVLYPSTAPQTPHPVTAVLGILIYGTLAAVGLFLSASPPPGGGSVFIPRA
jgi:hypothetical protein